MAILPLETTELKRGCLVKNVSLAPAIEIFRSLESGSGIILVSDLDIGVCAEMFGWPDDTTYPDLHLVQTIGRLNSYDVYSLRIQFRELGVEIDSNKYLSLSDDKKADLQKYMRVFTMPLIKMVYGDREAEIDPNQDIVDLFRDPDTTVARENLEKLADGLKVDITAISKFLDDFADVYLSLAYFQNYVNDLTPKLIEMNEGIQGLMTTWEIRQDDRVRANLARLHEDLNDLLTSVTGRFEVFQQNSDKMWEDIDAEKFRRVKEVVIGSQKTVGGVLCGLGIKLNAWCERFPDPKVGSPNSRFEMLFSDIAPGIDRLQAIEREGREVGAAA